MCTLEKTDDNIFVLTLTGDDEHRLNPTLIGSILSALRDAKEQATSGSVLITTSRGKFFSNGFDLAWAQAAGSKPKAIERLQHMVELLKPVVAELISLPMPTIAAINGHAAAGGLILALSHDYVYMKRDRGLTIPDYFNVLLRAKIGSPSARRDVLLRGAKVRGDEAVSMGIVEGAHDNEERLREATMSHGKQLASRKWDGEVYKEIRKGLYPELCVVLGLGEAENIKEKEKLLAHQIYLFFFIHLLYETSPKPRN
ncbi:enoyl-CoA delta isomerase [Salix suchowensis]|nr:enoyl-CoA delta isomerase [Salix suchowensis]